MGNTSESMLNLCFKGHFSTTKNSSFEIGVSVLKWVVSSVCKEAPVEGSKGG